MKKHIVEKFKIFKKIKQENGRRKIYFFGIKIFSYRKKKKENISNLLHINKEKLDKKIKCFNEIGINKTDIRNPKLIVSLTSFPERMYDIHYCLYSLLNQSLKPDMVVLWLGYDKFPNKEKDLPKSLLNLKKNGLIIKWCKDIKSYTKLIPSLKTFPDDIIITVDDDIYYSKNLVEFLYNAYKKNPKMLHCLRAHKITFDINGNILPYNKWKKEVQNVAPSFTNFLTGVGGVLYPPKSLYKDISNEKLFKSLAPNADDVWFWAMTVKNRININVVNSDLKLIYINPERELGLNGEITLANNNVLKNENDIQLKNVINKYNIKVK